MTEENARACAVDEWPAEPAPEPAVCTPAARVLVVEDDDDLRDTLLRYLGGVGMFARGVSCAEDLDAALAQHVFDAVVCDVNLPGEDGFTVLARVRALGAMRVVMLTARGMVDDRLHGLGLGADYYLVKPVNLRELEMVLHNLLQRSQEVRAQPTPAVASDTWRFQPTGWGVLAPDGQRVQLTNSEARLIHSLFARAGEVVERSTLLTAMGRPSLDAYERNLDVTVSRLRRKVEQACGHKLPVVSVRGEGYCFQGVAGIDEA
jgi:DNA-binding response OmpR family regulator